MKTSKGEKWLEFSIAVSPEMCQAVSELFDRYGEGGAVVEIIPGGLGRYPPKPSAIRIKTFLPAGKRYRIRRRALESGLLKLKRVYPGSESKMLELTESDWSNAWKKAYRTQEIGQRLLIVPTWKAEPVRQDKIVIRLDPGMAFGTGLHETTRLCLLALERYLRAGDLVLDVGTGSGIQAIAAAKLGASRVTATDIEPVAVQVAGQNVILNGVSDRVLLFTGTLKELARKIQPAHLIVVNILTYEIIKMLPALREKLHPGGYLISGGILAELVEEFEAALAGVSLKSVERLAEEDWVTSVAQAEVPAARARTG